MRKEESCMTREEAAVSVKGRILFENSACMVINKMPGESSEFPGIEQAYKNGKFPLPVHRLDLPVSGCLLLARTARAAAFLGGAFAGRKDVPGRAEKRYWAIIEKPAEALPKEGELVHLLGRNRGINKSFALTPEGGDERPPESKTHAFSGPPKKAVLRYRQAGEGDRYLFLEIDLVTGRHHQIRAQLAAIGLHIKGDLKYGARRSEKNGGIRLHAYSLAFPNPLDSGEIIRVTARPPVMDALWTAFAETAAGF